ncbi:hypothetical protein GOBAR_AA14822 [Gossypium barbadense]|uniref:MBD domain-containing protein n=1 Tax=Gossypium barbadense TaxID=3634 RepID=A0A2P5XR73_GOSBA|nr:hypothetical protein GOBAR_AA14822 [Gossypium barbadense]
MDDQKDIKDIKVLPSPIPEGWVLDTKFKEDGTEVKCYLCPATEQQFYTYEDLMRYVRYAKAAKVSIYSPASGSSYDFITILAEARTSSLYIKGATEHWPCKSMNKRWWQLPTHGWVKMNVDGSVLATRPKAAIDGVMRGSNGGWTGGFDMMTCMPFRLNLGQCLKD